MISMQHITTLDYLTPSLCFTHIMLFIVESVFGSQLQSVCSRDGSNVPIFLKLCLQEIEKRGKRRCNELRTLFVKHTYIHYINDT